MTFDGMNSDKSIKSNSYPDLTKSPSYNTESASFKVKLVTNTQNKATVFGGGEIFFSQIPPKLLSARIRIDEYNFTGLKCHTIILVPIIYNS